MKISTFQSRPPVNKRILNEETEIKNNEVEFIGGTKDRPKKYEKFRKTDENNKDLHYFLKNDFETTGKVHCKKKQKQILGAFQNNIMSR